MIPFLGGGYDVCVCVVENEVVGTMLESHTVQYSMVRAQLHISTDTQAEIGGFTVGLPVTLIFKLLPFSCPFF